MSTYKLHKIMKYKPIYKMLLLPLCATMLGGTFVSCSNTEADTDETSIEVRVPISISSVTIKSSIETRKADYDANYFEEGDVIGLFILADDCESPYDTEENCYNIPATYDGKQWNLSQDIYLSDDYAYVIAYYPYSESYGNVFPNANNLITLPISIVPVDNEQNDVLTCANFSRYNNDDPEVSLTFSHALSRITLSITVDETLDKNADLISACLYEKSGKLVTSAQLGFSWDWFGLLESDEYFSEEYFTLSCMTSLSSSTAYVVDFLIDPSTSTNLIASLVINSKDAVSDIALPSDGWKSGYQYTYYLYGTAPEDEEEQISFEVLSSSYIEGWTDKGTVDEIDIEYEDTEEEDSSDVEYVNGYAAVDLGLSVKWATCNVGAESPEDYGDYYQWGSLTPLPDGVGKAIISQYSISGNSKYDAATANWGDSWRMPTYAEWYNLVSKSTIAVTYKNNVKGVSITGPNGNSIFLPFSSFYGLNSTTIYNSDNESSNCRFYMPVGVSSGPTIYYYNAEYLDISNDGDYQFGTIAKDYGLTIRPVTESE